MVPDGGIYKNRRGASDGSFYVRPSRRVDTTLTHDAHVTAHDTIAFRTVYPRGTEFRHIGYLR